jgi:NAD(P)-dependent dehydrogenase (short-subunit alcohol dehydrogenase family)
VWTCCIGGVIELTGKRALVLGATRGIGRATALALGACGATVIASGRSPSTAAEVVSAIERTGASGVPVVCDITNVDATAATLAGLGRVDIAVVNAGVNPLFKKPEDLQPAEWDQLMAVNLRGAFFATQAVGRAMLRHGGGSIVSVSSASVLVGAARGLPYTASKGGLDAVTRSLALDWAGHGVRVNGVAPGYVETDLTQGLIAHTELSASLRAKVPLGRFAACEEVASAICFLASDAASYITGQTLYVDGGMLIY